MLVLSRKPLETIVLSNGAVFKVLGIERGRVRIGVAAPDGVRILRGECAGAQPNVEAEPPET
jgi:carbon storage regulator CsrA